MHLVEGLRERHHCVMALLVHVQLHVHELLLGQDCCVVIETQTLGRFVILLVAHGHAVALTCTHLVAIDYTFIPMVFEFLQPVFSKIHNKGILPPLPRLLASVLLASVLLSAPLLSALILLLPHPAIIVFLLEALEALPLLALISLLPSSLFIASAYCVPRG